MDTTVVIKAFAFGVTIAATIGPIALLIVNVAAVDGLGRGLRAGVGAATADLMFAVTAFVGGYGLTSLLSTHGAALTAVGSVVLLGFGAWMVVRALRPVAVGETARHGSLGAPFLQTFALTIVNPLGIVLFMGLAVQLPPASSLLVTALLSLCVFAGSLLVQAALALCGALLARSTDATSWRTVLNVASGLGVAAFGLAGLWPVL